jgi:putative FmdB family regulatory protein
VPTYEYQCDQCHRTFEVRQRITAEPLTRCEACGGPLRRLLAAAPFILKGEGWYVTDYPSEARKKARDAEKATAPGEAKDSTSAGKSSTSEAKEPSTTSSPAAKEPSTTSGPAAPSPSPSA